jgi:hypothetical protein
LPGRLHSRRAADLGVSRLQGGRGACITGMNGGSAARSHHTHVGIRVLCGERQRRFDQAGHAGTGRVRPYDASCPVGCPGNAERQHGDDHQSAVQRGAWRRLWRPGRHHLRRPQRSRRLYRQRRRRRERRGGQRVVHREQTFTVQSPSRGTCNIVDPINVQCFFARYGARAASGGIHPGESATITYPSNGHGILDSVSVNYDFADIFPGCRPSGFGSDLRFGPTFTAGAAAADCLAPTNVRITAMHINTKQRTASFRQTAQHATGFGCRLERNNTVMFSHSCGAHKVYANPLPAARTSIRCGGSTNPGSHWTSR